MGELTIITETGMFHSAARATIKGRTTWYGFKPKTHSSPVGAGFVDNSDRTKDIKYWASWDIDDVVLQAAVDKESKAYATSVYIVTVQDCVSFTANVCRDCKMYVPDMNVTPYGFLQLLKFWNTPKASGQTAGSVGHW